eukprot:gene48577-62734_t
MQHSDERCEEPARLRKEDRALARIFAGGAPTLGEKHRKRNSRNNRKAERAKRRGAAQPAAGDASVDDPPAAAEGYNNKTG